MIHSKDANFDFPAYQGLSLSFLTYPTELMIMEQPGSN